LSYRRATCSQAAPAGMAAASAHSCKNVPAGGNCTYACDAGFALLGAPYVCRPDGVFTGSQTCQSGASAWSAFGVLPGDYIDGDAAFCAGTRAAWLVAPNLAGAGTKAVLRSLDGGETWAAF